MQPLDLPVWLNNEGEGSGETMLAYRMQGDSVVIETPGATTVTVDWNEFERAFYWLLENRRMARGEAVRS